MSGLLNELRAIALRSLRRMYRPDERLFAFRLRRRGGEDVLEGASVRYSAMALIGLANEPADVARHVLRGESSEELCDQLVARLSGVRDLGDVAATLWAAALLERPSAIPAFQRLIELDPLSSEHSTVERAWALTALCANNAELMRPELATSLANQLIATFRPGSGAFLHSLPEARQSRMRRHVSCFADLVYPVIALSRYGVRAKRADCLDIAEQCASAMCEGQGADGQWWWHFDNRSGEIVERYPVYAVHQDAMAPMALFAAEECCGADFGGPIRRGLEWLDHAPEIGGSLIDRKADTIWRKVARREPNKMSRGIHAACSALHLGWKMPGLEAIFRPTLVDFESRPYHMGWILHAWPEHRVRQFSSRWEGEKHEGRPGGVAVASSV
ncbi:MAG TPA: hypothetical protein VNT79_17105 [Phycisphaerae bacterium]|nr:hypothetical protein [Phycisphaerae bacterium]